MRTSYFLALIFSASGFSQVATGVVGGGGFVRSGTFTASTTIGPMPVGPAVAGLPYSCEQVSEHTQTLSDGTHISDRRIVTKMFRDSAGRTRTERPFMIGPLGSSDDAPVMIDIFDPVAGYHYVLDSTRRVAHRSAASAIPPFAPPPPPPGSARLGVQGALIPGIVAGPDIRQLPHPEMSNESLGTKIIEGLTAEGHRTTMTYAVGAIGNDRPLLVTHEMWMSPELRILLLSINHDPRSGDSTMKIQNVSRAEPDPALFQVPPDFETVDDNGPLTIQFSSPPAPAK